jgi:O-antigen/teichoic acid export membrane protein
MSISVQPVRKAMERYSQGGVAADSVALIITSGLTAAAGFLFWTLAARMLPTDVLGVESALLSLMTTVGTVAAIGVGNSFTALLPIPGCDRRHRLRDGYLIVGAVSLTLGVLAGGIASVTLHLELVHAVPLTVIGTVTMGFFAVKDSAMIGLGGAAKLPVQNILASAGKTAIFPVLAVACPRPAVLATLVAAGLAAVIVIAVIIPRLRTFGSTDSTDRPPQAPTRKDITVFAARDGVASALSLGVLLALPFMTTAIAGPTEGAILAIALSIAQVLDLVSAGVGTALTTGLAADPSSVWQRAQRAWLVTTCCVLAAGIGVIVVSPVIMAVLGPNYREHPVVLVLIVFMLGSSVRIAYVVWASVLRAKRHTGTLLVVNGSTAAVAIPAILFGASEWGAVGAAAGLSAGSAVLGVIGAVNLLRGGRGADG